MLRTFNALLLLLALLGASAAAQPVPRWMTLPPTPALPTPQTSGHAAVNGISIWYATFGSGPPVVLLHGGLANSNYWAIRCRPWPRPIASLSWTAAVMAAAHATPSPSATPAQYKSFVDEISAMWATQPHWTAQDLNAIRVPTWIVDADHDEAIHRENTEFMAPEIPNAGLLLQPEVSHFSMLQAPRQFTDDVRHFLERKWD
jgi:pimeloyl-ACP methyl ester carboxylesterase